MTGAATIVIVHPDLSIAGQETPPNANTMHSSDVEAAFFSLLRLREPDVIVLDCRTSGDLAIDAIRKIRTRTGIPLLVACEAGDRRERGYRLAGATDCLHAPFDIVMFNRAVQAIIGVARDVGQRAGGRAGRFEVAGITFDAQCNEIGGGHGQTKLTTAENQLLLHLVKRPWRVCGRAEISDVLYGPHRPTSDRAIDVLVARLRRKLATVGGQSAQMLIKTEFRLGYMLMSDVSDIDCGTPRGRAAVETTPPLAALSTV